MCIQYARAFSFSRMASGIITSHARQDVKLWA